MTAASRPQVVTLRSGDVVRLRQVRPGYASALARAYANLSEQSRYRRFFTTMPKLPEATLKAAAKVDHENHEALVAVPLLSSEIVGECRFIRRADQPDSADAGVTVVDAWQGRGLGSALLIRLSERALELGIGYFTAEILAENRTMLALLPSLGRVDTESLGPVVAARVELAVPPRQTRPDLLDLLTAAPSGQIVRIPDPLRRLIRGTRRVPSHRAAAGDRVAEGAAASVPGPLTGRRRPGQLAGRVHVPAVDGGLLRPPASARADPGFEDRLLGDHRARARNGSARSRPADLPGRRRVRLF